MKVVYTAPNRGHHYRYAIALQAAEYLYAFVSGFPRLNPRAKAPELAGKLHRADIIQTLYIGSLKANLPVAFSNWLALLSKIAQDYACRKFVRDCDIFLFYNGCGLGSCLYEKKHNRINIVEAVNSHVEYQEKILQEEYERLNLKWQPFSKREKTRRLKEYQEADYILLPSEFVKQSFLEKGFPENKLLKVAYGFDKIEESKLGFQRNNTNTFTILYVGSISVRKGVRYLIEAFAKLQHPQKQLLLVGPDVDDGALTGIKLTSDITLTGSLKGNDLKNAYKSATIFCLPSIEEGLALVIGEALSFGLPIIATCNTGADDIITNGEEGYIVPIRDSEAICEKLQALIDNPELLQQVSNKAYQKAGKLCGWQETEQKLVEALYKVYNNASLE